MTAATGGVADDHDVLEFLTHTFADRQMTVQNQGATDEQAKKYKEEYEKYEQELKSQQAEFVISLSITAFYSCLSQLSAIPSRRHDTYQRAAIGTPSIDRVMLMRSCAFQYESEYDREFRTILEGQDQIRLSLTSIDRKMADIMGRVERIASNNGGQQQISGQAQVLRSVYDLL